MYWLESVSLKNFILSIILLLLYIWSKFFWWFLMQSLYFHQNLALGTNSGFQCQEKKSERCLHCLCNVCQSPNKLLHNLLFSPRLTVFLLNTFCVQISDSSFIWNLNLPIKQKRLQYFHFVSRYSRKCSDEFNRQQCILTISGVSFC